MDFTQESEVDIAYFILSQSGETVYFKELIMDVIDKKNKPVQSLSKSISEVYTLINMDSRFHYDGKGMWGLTEWIPQEVKRSHSSAASKTTTKTGTKRREKLLEEIQDHDVVVKNREND